MTKLRLLTPQEKARNERASTEATHPEASPPSDRRRLAPGAPNSPGTVPLELAMLLRREEPAVWWNEKDHVSWPPVAWTAAGGLLLIALASGLAPEFWTDPLRTLWRPLLVPLLPAVAVLMRELVSRRAILVTDTSVIEVPVWGEPDRIAFRNVRLVKRDLLTGGVLLQGNQHTVRIPPSLMEDCRHAIASQTRNQLGGSEGPDDRLGWLPKPGA